MKKNNVFKTGLIIILIGFFIPTVLFPFASTYEPQMGLAWNLQKMKLVLLEEKREYIADKTGIIDPWSSNYVVIREEKFIHYKYAFVLGVVFIFCGVILLIVSRKKISE